MKLNEAKSAIQEAGYDKWDRSGRKGTIAGATGIGKSKIAIDAIAALLKEKPDASILIVVPTEALRDNNWPAEIRQWMGEDALEQIDLVCYRSASRIKGQAIDLLIMDEIHNITPTNAVVLAQNQIQYVLGLTATVPDPTRDIDKFVLIRQHAPVVFTYNLDQGVEDGVVADYHVYVVMAALDAVNKNITAGTQNKRFQTTESAHYRHLEQTVTRTMRATGPRRDDAIRFALLRRMRFIYNLPSKTRLAKQLLSYLPDHLRIIGFCGGIEQSRDIFGEDVYNSKDKALKKLEAFKDLKINRLGTVAAVNEGHNIPGLDIGLVIQTDSNQRSLVQRMGRVLRWREGHKAVIFVLCAQGTQDESWVKKVLEELNSDKVTYLHENEIKSGNFLQLLPENLLKKS